jgi:recombination associated protein RdgC
MWFRNLQLYRVPANWQMSVEALNTQLSRYPLRACSGFEVQTQGWTAPRALPEEVEPSLVYSVAGQFLLQLTVEKKLLPSSVIKQEMETKAAQLENQQGFKVGRKQMREIKEHVTSDLLPRAFSVRASTKVWINPKTGLVAVDSATPAKAELIVALLCKSVPGLPLIRVDTIKSPASCMTSWLAADEAPQGFSIDQDTELRASDDTKATLRLTRQSMAVDEANNHITQGKQCVRLAMTWQNRVSFVLSETFVIKRVAPVDVITETDSGDNVDERFDADFVMMAGEVTKMTDDLIEALGGEGGGDAGEVAASEGAPF